MIHDILDSISNGLDNLLQLIVGGKHSYKGDLGKVYNLLKRKHKKGNGLRINNRYIALDHILKGGMLLLSKTGGGKSSKLFLKNLLSLEELAPTSIIALDLAKELRDKSGGYVNTVMDGEDVLNFCDSEASTITWNPIEDLKLTEIQRFSSDLVASNSSGNSSSDPIWDNLSTSLISYLIQLLKRIEATENLKGFTNLYNVRYLTVVLQGDASKVNALISKYSDDLLYSNFKAILANDQKFLNSVLSNVLSVLVLWSDEHIIRTTSSTSLDMSAYRNTKRILWIQSEITQQQRLKGLNSLFLKSWFNHIMNAGIPDKDSNTIAFYADEMSAIHTTDKGYIAFISSQIRKFKSYGLFGYQSYNQCIELYDKQNAETLKQNTGTVLYLGKQDLDTSSHISKSLGRYSYKDYKDRQHSREVLTPEEVMNNSKEGGFLLSSVEKPILLKRIKGYYQDRKLKERSEIPAPELIANNTMPQLLPIDELIADVQAMETTN